MSKELLLEQWKKEENDFRLIGWDFSYIDGRMVADEPPWDFRSIIKSYGRNAF